MPAPAEGPGGGQAGAGRVTRTGRPQCPRHSVPTQGKCTSSTALPPRTSTGGRTGRSPAGRAFIASLYRDRRLPDTHKRRGEGRQADTRGRCRPAHRAECGGESTRSRRALVTGLHAGPGSWRLPQGYPGLWLPLGPQASGPGCTTLTGFTAGGRAVEASGKRSTADFTVVDTGDTSWL